MFLSSLSVVILRSESTCLLYSVSNFITFLSFGQFKSKLGFAVSKTSISFHNIFGPQGTWKGGREKSPAAMCRKAAESKDGDIIEVWGNGMQTRSFLYVEECVEAVLRLMDSDFTGPVNIGSEEMVTINQLAGMAIAISEKNLEIKNIDGEEFVQKYGFKCPLGVKGRNSDNNLYREKIGWEVSQPLSIGLKKTYNWIKSQVDHVELNTPWIYESPDGGNTIYRREPGNLEKQKIK